MGVAVGDAVGSRVGVGESVGMGVGGFVSVGSTVGDGAVGDGAEMVPLPPLDAEPTVEDAPDAPDTPDPSVPTAWESAGSGVGVATLSSGRGRTRTNRATRIAKPTTTRARINTQPLPARAVSSDLCLGAFITLFYPGAHH